MRWSWWTRVAVLTAMASVASCKSCKDKKAAPSAVTATVAAPTAPVKLADGAMTTLPVTVTFANASDKPITMSAFATGNITVSRIVCGGADIAGRAVLANAFAPPSAYAAKSLETVGAKNTLAIEMSGVTSVTEVRGRVTSLHYRVEKPGACTVSLRYEYRGPDGGHADLVRGPIEIPPFEVTFQ